MSREEPVTKVSLTRITAAIPTAKEVPAEDVVIKEAPVTIFVNDEELATLICLPQHIKELAVGFLCAEGIIEKPEDLRDFFMQPEEGLVWVQVPHEVRPRETFLKRYLTPCCGRARASFYFVGDARLSPVTAPLAVSAEAVLAFSRELEEKAVLFRTTGGTHAAALCSPQEQLLLYEDVGRHNAVDKIFGRAFLDQTPLHDKLLVFSGRVSAEILLKVARMGVPVLAARGAPTSLALEMARELGITLAGFVRGQRMNVYTHPERIIP